MTHHPLLPLQLLHFPLGSHLGPTRQRRLTRTRTPVRRPGESQIVLVASTLHSSRRPSLASVGFYLALGNDVK